MVHLSALFIALVGSSFVSANNVPPGAVHARDTDLSLGQTIRDAKADESYIKHINIYYTQDGLKTGVVSGDVVLNTSPLSEPVTLDAFYAHGTGAGVRYLSIDTTLSGKSFPSVFLPPYTTKNTGRIENIKVKHDLTPIMKSGLIDADAAIMASLQNGSVVTLRWNQTSIPITFKEE